jgi:hypothetical protein
VGFTNPYNIYATSTVSTPPATVSGGPYTYVYGENYSQIYHFEVVTDLQRVRMRMSASGVSQYGAHFTWEPVGSWRWDDVVFTCQNGAPSVDVGMNVRLKGRAVWAEAYPPPGATPIAGMALYLGHFTYAYNAGVWYPQMNIGMTAGSGTGVFAGINSNELDGIFSYPLGSFPTGIPVVVSPLPLSIDTVIRTGAFQHDFYDQDFGMSLPTDGPVFDLPEGCTCNSAQMGVCNNSVQCPPVPTLRQTWGALKATYR